MHNYLSLQQLRFGSRLDFEIHQETIAGGWDIPPLLLQPLVENAVVHGAACTNDPTRVDVRVKVDGEDLWVEVDNTRGRCAAANVASTGVGLHNTRQRLERLYGNAFRLDAGPEGQGRYRVRVSLPRAACA